MIIDMSIKSANKFTRIKGDRVPDFESLAKRSVAIGLPDDVIHDPSGLTMSALGTIHEFGSPDENIPQRSFLRSFLVDKKGDIERVLKTLAKGVVQGRSAETQLEKLALYAQSAVQEQIVDVDTPANSPITIARKGSENPLIDTGAMRQAVVGLVVDND